MEKTEHIYLAPRLDTIQMRVEQGIAASFQDIIIEDYIYESYDKE